MALSEAEDKVLTNLLTADIALQGFDIHLVQGVLFRKMYQSVQLNIESMIEMLEQKQVEE